MNAGKLIEDGYLIVSRDKQKKPIKFKTDIEITGDHIIIRSGQLVGNKNKTSINGLGRMIKLKTIVKEGSSNVIESFD